MIGLDTNVLVRVLADEDDPAADRARAFLVSLQDISEAVWVNHVVLCELAWVLRSTRRFSRAEIADLIDHLLATRPLQVADAELVATALQIFRGTRLDFADALIGVLNRRAGCATTYTFDRAAAETADFTAVS
ncbi:MAG: PIN domain-containing protein [Geminicoccaceae bacterium]